MSAAVLCVGGVVVDDVFSLPSLPRGDGKFFAHTRARAMGGMAAAAAAAIASLGGRASLWANVGDDDNGDYLINELKQYGVRPILSRRKNTTTAVSLVCTDDIGRRMIVNHSPRALSAAPARAPSLRGYQAALADIRWHGGALSVLRAAKKLNIPAVLDWESSPAQAQTLLQLAKCAAFVIFSEAGLKQFDNKTKGAFKLRESLRHAAKQTGAQVAVTCGARGVVFLREDSSAARIAARKVKTKNTLGAGDVFHGAFALAIAEGAQFEPALEFASAAAAAKCAKAAGKFPTMRETKRILRSKQ